MFSADYVVPPALSIPLGTSGSSVDVVKEENGTFSINGETITAETRVTAENGNVYRALLSPEGMPIGVDHVAAMQDVMLGSLGGTITLTQSEDKSWMLGDITVTDGYVHTAANGNMYALMMDADGMWSGMYQEVMVTVALGTRGSVTLTRSEDMSWWLGSESVMNGSMVNSANGNEYMLSMSDGDWTAMFQPVSMMIEGTGLTAMTREGDDMYDVGDATLPASGVGDVTVDGAMYHVWMMDGALMGARFDKAIDGDTDYKVKLTSALPYLSANDSTTAANELRTHLVITGDNDSGMGMFSFGDLLGSGMASSEGKLFVDQAVTTIEKVRADVDALLALDTKPAGLDTILETQWSKLESALDNIFGTNSAAADAADRTSAVRQDAPREEDILDAIDDVLDALASEANFVAATHDDRDNRGVFKTTELGTGKAADTFNRLTWTAAATMGMTGSTRYGTVIRKSSTNAKSDPTTEDFGAFAYSTMQETARTADVVAPTGIASYSGGTEAISGAGKTYSGTMELQVRFSAELVSGVVRGLEDADGMPWQHNFADVDRIILDDAKLRRNGTWVNLASRATQNGTVFYTANSGLLRPVDGIANTLAGRLLGRGADAGSEAVGVWSVGDPDSTGSASYLAGGFGVMHVADTARPLPSGDDGSAATTQLFTQVADVDPNMSSAKIADGMLEVKGRRFGWAGRQGATAPTYQALGTTGDETLITAKFNLAEMAAASGTAKTLNGPKHIDAAIAVITAQRDQLSILKGLDDRTDTTRTAEAAAWQKVTDAVQFNVFGGLLPAKLKGDYATDTDLQADALDLIDRVLDALSSNAKLEAALDPDGTGIFDHYDTGTADDPATDAREDLGNYRVYDANDRRYEVNTRTIGNIRGEREHKVISVLGTTEFTRFGLWRRESTTSARRNDGVEANVIRTHGGPGTFAYSPLDKARVGTLTNLGFPSGGSATYEGETVALQNTTILTGTAHVGVSWATPTSVAADTTVGTMALEIRGLASAAGDPLSEGGSATVMADGSTTGDEIADIVFPGIVITVGDQGTYAGNMIAAAKGSEDADGDFSYEGEAAVSNFRYRLVTSAADQDGSGSASAKALFVGQGVDGPLGVIGTWTLADTTVGRIAPTGDHTDDVGQTIYGAFGVEVP